MADNSDVYIAAKALIKTIQASFLFSEQLAVLESFLHELHEHLETERDKKWPYIHTLTLVLKKLTYFLRLNFVIKERAPKELPVLRKMRTILAINDLATEYQGYFRELQNIVIKPDIKKKFKEGSIAQILSEEEEQERISTDIQKLIEEFSKISFKTCYHKDDDIHEDLRQIQKDFMSSLEMEKSHDSFEIFNRNDFKIFLNDIDEKLLVVNRNILMQISSSQQSARRLQKAITEADLDFTEFEHEDVNERFKGVWGDFSFALYTPHVSRQQRQRDRAAGVPPVTPKKVLVQRVTVDDLSSHETVSLGYNIRQFEMIAEEVSKSKSILKFYGHYRVNNDLFIVSQSVQLNLAELYESKKNHVFTGKEVIEVALHVSNALQYLHNNAQIHGDIRPENIFFTDIGFKGDIKLGNFSHSLDKENELFGAHESKRVAYKAPETIDGDVKYESSDVYSLSIVIWNLLHPDSLPYDYVTSTANEIRMDISTAVKPMIKYEEHCKNLPESDRLSPDDWSNVAEMLQFMWNQEPSDRPSSTLCYDFFKLEKNTIGTTNARTSVFIVQKEVSKRKKHSEPADPIDEEEPPELPPRASSVYSGRFSKELEKGSNHFRPYTKPLTRGTNVPRVKSRGRMEKPISIKSIQEKHDSKQVSNRARSEVTNLKKNPASVGLTQPVGVDNIPADEIKNELELFRESLDLEGKNMDNFSIEEEVEFCLKFGLVDFNNRMRVKHGRGLKRFEGTGPEITAIPTRKKKQTDDAVGLNGITEHLKKNLRKQSRFSILKKGTAKTVELEEDENDNEVLTLDDMAKHLKKQLKKDKRLSINQAKKGSKLIRRINTKKGGVLGRVKSLRPMMKSRIGRRASQGNNAEVEGRTSNLRRLMTGKGSKLARKKRVESDSSGPEV